MSFDADALQMAIDAHGPVTRVVIARMTGSSPRDIGTSMLVWADGQTGTIGGGTLEYTALAHARGGGIGACDYPLGPTLGQCCGGHVTLVYERFTAAPSGTAPFARRIFGTAPPPKWPQSKWPRSKWNEPTPQYKDGWLCEPIACAAQPLWLWGAGHVGRAVADVMHDMPGFAVTWADVALDRFPDAPPPGVTIVSAAHLPDLMAHAPAQALHLIFTYAHDMDLELCHTALERGFAYCGLIGSCTKWARFRNRLAALGHANSAINRITCPIGDPSLGKHPKMIALGVAQGLIGLVNT
ncbi:MAG: xanthine dehydrogenase accessory protein XdhC [Pseudomonadota bacterium]